MEQPIPIPSDPSVTSAPPPAGSSHCSAGGGQHPRAHSRPSPNSYPAPPSQCTQALRKLFLLFPSPPAPFGTQRGGSSGSDNRHTGGSAPGRAAPPPPLPTWSPLGGSREGRVWVGLAQHPWGRGLHDLVATADALHQAASEDDAQDLRKKSVWESLLPSPVPLHAHGGVQLCSIPQRRRYPTQQRPR